MTDLEQVAASHGFTAVKSEPISEVEGTVHLMHHAASGARLMFIENDDANKAFSITFKTPADDDTGVFHILEHSVLCGSEKFPVKEPFVNLLKTSMQTFLNAMTFPDKTMYPVASTNEQDLVNLMDVYLDAVFHPDIYRRPVIFQQEGWHRELEGEGEGERLVVNGVVYNEMKGALSEPIPCSTTGCRRRCSRTRPTVSSLAARRRQSQRSPTRAFSRTIGATTVPTTPTSSYTATWMPTASSAF